MGSTFLIIKTSSIGDVIQTFPVVEYLKRKFPGCAIDWVVEEAFAPLLDAHPQIRDVIVLDTRKWRKKPSWKAFRAFRAKLKNERYDAVFDLQGNIKSALITAMTRSSQKIGFGWNSTSEKPNVLATTHRFDISSALPIQQRYLKLVQAWLGDPIPFEPTPAPLLLKEAEHERLDAMNLPQNCYLVAAGSKWASKKLPLSTLTELLQLIPSAHFILIWGSPPEKQEAEELHAALPDRSTITGDLSLPLLQAIIRRCSGVIAVDSAILALSGTTSTPSYSIFGPSLASVYKPVGDQNRSIQGECPYGRKFNARCPILRSCKTAACIRTLSALQIDEQLSLSSLGKSRGLTQELELHRE